MMDNLINDFRTSNAIDRFIFTCEYVTLHSENNVSDEIKNTHFAIGTFFLNYAEGFKSNHTNS